MLGYFFAFSLPRKNPPNDRKPATRRWGPGFLKGQNTGTRTRTRVPAGFTLPGLINRQYRE
jgi:hypothetical protein